MAQDLSSRRALIVDDEFLIAFDLEASMHELGFDVCNVASNEKDAKELAMSNPPDVAVIDVYLGGARTGIETARWLKEVCDVPIVFVTAHSDDSTLERIHDLVPGAPVLSKPVYRDTLAHAVSEAVH
jgi:DNA-binding NarL/FixJ family response regulator